MLIYKIVRVRSDAIVERSRRIRILLLIGSVVVTVFAAAAVAVATAVVAIVCARQHLSVSLFHALWFFHSLSLLRGAQNRCV